MHSMRSMIEEKQEPITVCFSLVVLKLRILGIIGYEAACWFLYALGCDRVLCSSLNRNHDWPVQDGILGTT